MRSILVLLVFIVASLAAPNPTDMFNSVFDPLNEGFTQELYGHYGPVVIFVGVAFDNGNVYVTNCDTNAVIRFTPATYVEHGSTLHVAEVVQFASNIPGQVLGCSLINGADGYFYYGTYTHGILRIDPANNFDSVPLPGPSAFVRLGLSMDPQDNNKIHYVTTDSLRIRVFDISTGVDSAFTGVIGILIDGIYWNEDGSILYCADLSGNKVVAVDRNGNVVANYPDTNPDGIAFHVASKTVFTNNSPGTLSRIDPVSNTVTTFASGAFRGDMGAVGPDGCWYITQQQVRFFDGVVTGTNDNGIVRICGGFATPPGVPPPCNATGTYHTQSEGDWGDSCAENFATGCYRDDNFDTCFPNGLTVGCVCMSYVTKDPVKQCGYSLHFDSSADVENFLPQLGAPGVLDHDYNNPSNPPPMSTSSGNFGGQVTALALSIGFSACDPNFHTACGKLEDLYVCDNRCANCKRNGNCRKNSNGCKYLREEELDIEEEDEIDFRTNKNTNFNNNNNGKPKYANCEAYFGKKISEIFDTAQRVLGGCANCGALSKKTEERNNKNNNNNCVRTSGCRRNAAARNNNNCNRNSDCKRNQNCCCCPDQADPNCDPVLLNNCVTLINQAFIFGKTLDDVDSGNLFKENGCTCGGDGFEWTATVNNQVVVLNPFVVFTDMGDYYGYSKAGGDASSANTPDGLEDSNHNKALVEFVTDGFGNHNLLVIYDTPNDADGGDAQTQIIHSGNLDGATFVVQDDTGEGVSISPGLATTNHIWSPCCTDGYVFGPIPNLACFTFVLGPTTGITALRLASKGAPGGTAIEVPKTDGDSITVDICNRCKQA